MVRRQRTGAGFQDIGSTPRRSFWPRTFRRSCSWSCRCKWYNSRPQIRYGERSSLANWFCSFSLRYQRVLYLIIRRQGRFRMRYRRSRKSANMFTAGSARATPRACSGTSARSAQEVRYRLLLHTMHALLISDLFVIGHRLYRCYHRCFTPLPVYNNTGTYSFIR